MFHRHLAAASTLALGLAAGAAQAETTLLLSTFFPNTHPFWTDVLEPWAAAIAEETGGSVTIEFAASSLAPPAEQLAMVESGIADVAVQFTGLMPNRLTALTLTEIPGPGATAEAMSVALWRTQQQYFSDSDALDGVQLLSVFTFSPQALFATSDAVWDGVDDLAGARIATTPGTAASAWGAVSGGVVAGPAFRYFELVSKGMVDLYAAVTPTEVMGFNLAPYTTAMMTNPALSTAGSFVLVVNEGAWDRLSPEEQEIVTRLSGEAFAARLSAMDAAAAAATEQMIAQGATVSEMPASLSEGLAQAFAFLEADWIAGVEAQGIDASGALAFYRGQLVDLAGASE